VVLGNQAIPRVRMKQFYSLSQYPGKTGETYYRKFFNLKNLSHSYNALKCENIVDSVTELKNIKASGFSVSMPYKSSVISLLDEVDELVTQFNSCNTVVNVDGRYIGYNADYYGAIHVLKTIPEHEPINILGNGAMGNMFKKILGPRANIYSRSLGNWDKIQSLTGTVINCTSLGTSTKDSPFTKLPNISYVIDLAMNDNDLKKQTILSDIKYIGGKEFYQQQFKKQFEIYTGITLSQSELEDDN
jgi:shikimate 5-dehydrogenase